MGKSTKLAMLWFMMEFEWHDLNTPLSICLWLLSIVLAKIISHSSKRLTIVPDSALLILVGFAAGSIMDRFWSHEIYLHPDFFFLYLLPPIALDAGYALPNQAFFDNFGTIILYAVLGTIWNIASVGFILFLASSFFAISIPWIDLFLFSTLISAVDPVAVLSVFEEINVNRLLYICVFGESLLNDAVTIVMYHALAAMAKIESENLEADDFIKALISFFLVSFGGILIGIVGAAITGLATK
uniref:Cation/H+ exchanger domain-containing protein n=1 Tax=Setaria digitata TaxID=48799 RepID=A0A915Q2A3_9BILA